MAQSKDTAAAAIAAAAVMTRRDIGAARQGHHQHNTVHSLDLHLQEMEPVPLLLVSPLGLGTPAEGSLLLPTLLAHNQARNLSHGADHERTADATAPQVVSEILFQVRS